MKKFILTAMVILFTLNNPVFAVVVNENRQAEMEKTLFMAAGVQDRTLR